VPFGRNGKKPSATCEKRERRGLYEVSADHLAGLTAQFKGVKDEGQRVYLVVTARAVSGSPVDDLLVTRIYQCKNLSLKKAQVVYTRFEGRIATPKIRPLAELTAPTTVRWGLLPMVVHITL